MFYCQVWYQLSLCSPVQVHLGVSVDLSTGLKTCLCSLIFKEGTFATLWRACTVTSALLKWLDFKCHFCPFFYFRIPFAFLDFSQEKMSSTINVPLLVNKQIVQFALYNHWQQNISSFGVILESKIFYLLFAYLKSVYDMDIHYHEHYSYFSFCSFSTFQPRRRLQWKLHVFPTSGSDFVLFQYSCAGFLLPLV